MKADYTIKNVDSKLHYIDCLRGIAILMVIFTHADKHIKGLLLPTQIFADYCQMGVQLFFIVSAYTLCISMDKRKDSDENLRTFYIRRFFRIAPLYYFGIFLYFIYFSFISKLIAGNIPQIASQYTFTNILANLFFINDFVPGDANNNIVPGGWSIGTETTFYAIFPFIYLLYNKYRDSKTALVLFPILGFLISLSVILGIDFVATDIVGYDNFDYFKQNNSFLYYSILCQLPVFLIGMSLYFSTLKLSKASTVDKYYITLCFIGFSIIAVIIYKLHESFVYLLPLAPAISFFFLFLLFKEVSFLSNKILSRIGQLSFSIYLFHFVFAWEGSKLLYKLFGDRFMPETLYLINIIVTILLSVGIALFSEKYIENKGIEQGKRLINIVKSKKKKIIYSIGTKVA